MVRYVDIRTLLPDKCVSYPASSLLYSRITSISSGGHIGGDHGYRALFSPPFHMPFFCIPGFSASFAPGSSNPHSPLPIHLPRWRIFFWHRRCFSPFPVLTTNFHDRSCDSREFLGEKTGSLCYPLKSYKKKCSFLSKTTSFEFLLCMHMILVRPLAFTIIPIRC